MNSPTSNPEPSSSTNQQAVLLIDMGNTKSKLALAQNGHLISPVDLVDHEVTLSHALALAHQTQNNVHACLISSVAVGTQSIVDGLLDQGLPTLALSANMALPFVIDYATPNTLGSDRIAGAAGAYAAVGQSAALIIDAGTAITYDFLSANGHFQGGAISPGVRMRFKALHAFTAQLPLCTPRTANVPTIGTDTKQAIMAGVMNGVWAEVDFFINNFRLQNPNAPVFLAGGDGEYFDLTAKKSIFARPNLVLEGLALIADMNFDAIKRSLIH